MVIKKDTIWTEGYKIRDEWLKKADDFAKSEAIKIYPDFHEYNGHEFHYLIKSDTYFFLFLLYLVLSAILYGLVIIFFSNVILSCCMFLMIIGSIIFGLSVF